MSLRNEFVMLLHSDLSAAGVDQLTSRFGLWVRNTMIHWGMGFVAFFVGTYFPEARPGVAVAIAAYALLQVVQMFSPGSFVGLLADGAFDVAILGSGYAMAFALAMRQIPQ